MAQATGSRSQLAFVEEVTFGTTPNTPDMNGLPFTSESLMTEINTFQSEEIRSDRMVQKVLAGNIRPAGDVNFELQPEGLTTLFKHALGSVATSGSGPYTHQIDGASSLPTGLTIEKGFTDVAQYFQYTGCRINTLNMTIPQEGLITGSFSFLCQNETIDTSPLDASPDYPAKDPFVSYQCSLYEAADVSSFASALGVVTELSFTLENGLRDDQYVLGSRTRYNIPEGRRVVTGTMTLFFEDVTYYNKFINNTQAAIRIVVTNGTDTVTIWFPQIQYKGGSPTPQVGDDGPLVVTMPFQTERYATWNTDIRMTFVNDESSV